MMGGSHSMTMGQCPFDVSSLMTYQTLSKPIDDLVAEKTKEKPGRELLVAII